MNSYESLNIVMADPYKNARRMTGVSTSFESTLLQVISENSSEFFAAVYKGTRHLLWANKRALQMFEYDTEDELKRQYVSTLRKKKPGKEHLQLIFDAIEKKGVWEEVDELVTKTGRVFRGRIILKAFAHSGDDLLLVRIVDIEKEKKASEEIIKLNSELEQRVREKTHSLENVITELQRQVRITEQAKEELAMASHFQKAILDNAGAIIIATDKDGIIRHFNSLAEESLGYKPEELIGRKTPALFHDEEETRKRAAEFSKELGVEIKPGFEVFVAKAKRNLHNEHEWIHIRKNGSKFPVKLNVTAIRDGDYAITGYLGVSMDISDEKKVEAELLKNLQKEIELNKLKSNFVSIASHEFRTPLSGILSSATLLAKYTTAEEQPVREKYISQIKLSVKNLISILTEFLSLSKFEEGKVEANYETFDLKEFTDKLCREMKAVAKPGQAISYKHEGKPKVKLDPLFVRHILSNLTSNAIKYSPENSRIHISTKVKNGDILVSVKDNGIGIAKEDQKHLFERFFRASNAGGTQGTGLGLYIAKRYAEKMDGAIKMKSELGKGTEFIVQFPTKK